MDSKDVEDKSVPPRPSQGPYQTSAFRRHTRRAFKLVEGLPLAAQILIGLLILAAGFVAQIVLGVRGPAQAGLMIVLVLFVVRRNHAKLQESRPRTSAGRVAAGVRSLSALANPRFAGAVSTGIANLGKRLWTPRLIHGVIDFTPAAIRWDPLEGHLTWGFNAFEIAWSEITRVVVRADMFVLGAEWANVRLEGSFGTPIGFRIDFFDHYREMFESRNIPVDKEPWWQWWN